MWLQASYLTSLGLCFLKSNAEIIYLNVYLEGINEVTYHKHSNITLFEGICKSFNAHII